MKAVCCLVLLALCCKLSASRSYTYQTYTYQTSSTVCNNGSPSTRKGCPGAFGGITRAQCINLNCCFDSSVVNVPWCFTKTSGNGGAYVGVSGGVSAGGSLGFLNNIHGGGRRGKKDRVNLVYTIEAKDPAKYLKVWEGILKSISGFYINRNHAIVTVFVYGNSIKKYQFHSFDEIIRFIRGAVFNDFGTGLNFVDVLRYIKGNLNYVNRIRGKKLVMTIVGSDSLNIRNRGLFNSLMRDLGRFGFHFSLIGIKGSFNLSPFLSFINKAFIFTVGTFDAVVGGILNLAGNVLADVGRFVGTAVGDVFKGAAGIVGGVLNGAGHVVGGVLNGAGHIVGGVVNGVGRAVGGVVNGAANVVGGVVGGAANVVGGVVGGAAKAVGGVVNGIGHFFGGLFG